ncbi:MAG: AMP-binding protein, partial [Candidatus Binatia bacterium]
MKSTLPKTIPQSEGLWLLHLLTAIVAAYVAGRLTVDSDLEQLILYKAELEQLFRYSFLALESSWVDSHQAMTRVVSLLSPEEATPLLAGWNTGATRRNDHRAVHEMFEEQAALSPDEFALVCGGERLTYRELDQRANKLARYLRRKGINPGTLVGLCLERSPEMIVGILGVMKAGGAYVPLDPQYPRDRLKMLMDDIQTPILLTEQDLAERLIDFGAELVCLDLAPQVFEGESQEPLASEVTAGDLAYVIYTSGSTGRPKGVEVTHGGLVNYIVHAADVSGLAPADRVLQFASLSFDVAAEEIFCSLTRGATLVLRNDTMLSSVSDFLDTCQKWGITVLDLPTAYWHEITMTVYAENLTLPESIRLVIIGGERAIPERLTQWQARIGNRIRLFNSYGPTEATIAATLCELTGGSESEKSFGEVSIGGPIPNVQLYVSDQDLNPVPAG